MPANPFTNSALFSGVPSGNSISSYPNSRYVSFMRAKVPTAFENRFKLSYSKMLFNLFAKSIKLKEPNKINLFLLFSLTYEME